MSIILDNSIAGIKSNSYIDTAYATDYFTNHFSSSKKAAWQSLSVAQQTYLLVMATRVLETARFTNFVPISEYTLHYDRLTGQVLDISLLQEPVRYYYYQRLQFPRNLDILPISNQGQSFPITSATWANNVATLTIASNDSANPFTVYDSVFVSQVANAGYSGFYTVSGVGGSSGAWTINYTLSISPGGSSSGGVAVEQALYIPEPIMMAQCEQAVYMITFDESIFANRLQGVTNDVTAMGREAIHTEQTYSGTASTFAPMAFEFIREFLVQGGRMRRA